MSLILKQEPANTIATPPAGKSTLFVNDNSVMSVKSPDGNVTQFPTVSGANTQVLFNDDGALNGNANLTFNKTTSTMTVANLSVTGTLNAGDISVSSIANGTSNVDIIGVSGNVTTSVAGTANVVVVTATGANVTGTFSVSGNANVGNIGGAAGVFTTVTGSLTTASQPNVTSLGTLSSVSVSGNANVGNLGTAGLITATGNVGAGNVNTTGVFATTLSATANANVGNLGTAGLITATGNLNAGNIITGGVVSATGNVVAGNLNTAGTATASRLISNVATGTAPLTVTSTTRVANLNVDYANVADNINVTAPGTGTAYIVGANATTGNVSELTSSGISMNLSNNAVTATTFIGALSGAATTAGTVTTAAQPNITSTGTLASLSVTGNATAGNLLTGGVLSVSGTGQSSIAGNLNMNSQNITNLATPVNSTDAATKQYVDDVAQGLNIHDSCNAATTTTLASISGGTVTYNNGTAGVGATLTTTGSYTTIDGVTLTDGMRILVKNEATAANNGIYVRTSSTVLTRATDFNTVPEVESGDFTFVTAGTLYDNTGWVQTETVTTIGTSPISFTQFSGAGTYQAGTGLTLTGSVFSVNVAQPTITSVGTLTSLSISGNANIGNIGTGIVTATGNISTTGNIFANGEIQSIGNGTFANIFAGASLSVVGNSNIGNIGTTIVTATGNISAGNLNTAGKVTGSQLVSNVINGTAPLIVTSGTQVANLEAARAGTVTTAAQPNITSIGTLTTLNTGTLNATGNANVANLGVTGVFATTLSATGNANVGNLGTTGALSAATLTTSGNISIDRITTASFANFTGTVTANQFVSQIPTGSQPFIVTSTTQVSNLSVATAGSATTAGTVTTAAQPNITSLGTLTSLGVNGTVTAVALTANTGVITGNANGISSVQAANIVGTTLSSTVVSSSLTAVGTLASLSVTANANIGNIGTGGLITATGNIGGGNINTGGIVSAVGNVIAGNVYANSGIGGFTTLSASGNVTGANVNATTYNITGVTTGITAAGSTQGTATALTKAFNVVSTVTAGQGVVLPTAVAGMRVTVVNTSATTLLVYPASGGTINALALNAGYSLPTLGRLDFIASSTTQWYALGAIYV